MSGGKKWQCPICLKYEAQYFMDYPGSFLECSELHQCQSCEIIFAHPLPNTKDLNEYYTQGVYSDKNQPSGESNLADFTHKLSLSRINLIQNIISPDNLYSHVIDVGAGNAMFGKTLKDLDDKFIYDVVEPDQGIAVQYGEHVISIYDDITEAPQNHYDLVVMNQVLEHVIDPTNFIKTASLLLKKDGYLYIDVPFRDYIFKPSVSPHLYFYTTKSLTAILKEAGFSIEFCDSAGMTHSRAMGFFSGKRSFIKLLNPWAYLSQLSRLLKRCGINIDFDTFKQFQATQYGGDRQWLRCIAKKRN